jgi:hypothetical protein
MRRFGIVMAVVGLLVVAAISQEEQKGPITPKEKIVLWNGKDFAGWKLFVPDPAHDVTKTWSINEAVIRCEGRPAGYMRTEADYANYLFHVEWRWPERGGNSGVLVHTSGPDVVWPKSLECQLASENAGDFWVIGGIETKEHSQGGKRVGDRRTTKLKKSSEKPLGQWNSYDIICKDDWVVVLANGVLQNVATRCSVTSGKICLQSEGAQIEFRNIYVEPLE